MINHVQFEEEKNQLFDQGQHMLELSCENATVGTNGLNTSVPLSCDVRGIPGGHHGAKKRSSLGELHVRLL